MQEGLFPLCFPSGCCVLKELSLAEPQNKSSLKTWQLLTLCLSVPILLGFIFVVIKRKKLKQCLSTEQPQEEK